MWLLLLLKCVSFSVIWSVDIVFLLKFVVLITKYKAFNSSLLYQLTHTT